MILIKNGTLHTAVSKEPLQADILVDGGKIVKIGAGLSGEGADEFAFVVFGAAQMANVLEPD